MSEPEITVNSFYDYLNNGKLMGTVCEKCGFHALPPRSVCPKCGGSSSKWFESGGEGVLETFTVMYVLPTCLADQGSCIVGIVRLKEGPAVTGRIVGIDAEKIKIGMNLKLAPLTEKNRAVIAFKPV